jgi:SpoVK/Ycf46/Vps4 family AAA+-type ATPase
LRPGRFDLIIPVGAPDQTERADLAAEFLRSGNPDEVAARTAGFTPADFALVAQRSAQVAFDRALEGGSSAVTAEDVLAAIGLTRPSVSPEAAEVFAGEAELYSRL